MQARRLGLFGISYLAVAASLAGCGGGGAAPPIDGGGVVIVPPSAPSPATPPPPPTSGVPVFGALGQTATQSFVTLGFAYSGREVGGFGDLAVEASSVDLSPAIGLRLIAPTQLLFNLGGFGEGILAPSGSSATDASGRINQLGYRVLGGHATLSLVGLPNGDHLTSSAIGSWIGPPGSASDGRYRVANFAYGVPTSPAAMPTAGTARYNTSISGPVALTAPGKDVVAYYSGSADLTLDFGSRAVNGTIQIAPTDTSSSTSYSLSSAVLSSDRTSFQGQLLTPSGGPAGHIEGRFTGPSASEMIVRWRAPVQVNARSGLAFGVWGAVKG